MESILLTGEVKWSTSDEVIQRSGTDQIGAHVSGAGPFHRHSGGIALTDESIYINGYTDLAFKLNDLEQLFLGFDEVFPRSLLKNFGMMTSPLRMEVSGGIGTLYLFIDYNMLGATNNQLWFNTIREMLFF